MEIDKEKFEQYVKEFLGDSVHVLGITEIHDDYIVLNGKKIFPNTYVLPLHPDWVQDEVLSMPDVLEKFQVGEFYIDKDELKKFIT